MDHEDPTDELTQEHVDKWLTDRLGEPISVSVVMRHGEHNVILATLEGTLGRPHAFPDAERGQDVGGPYQVGGGASFIDLSRLPSTAERILDPVNEGNTLMIKLGEVSWLTLSGQPA